MKNLLRVPNASWSEDQFNAVEALDGAAQHRLPTVDGRFAVMHVLGETVRLTRDRLGLNKLFFAVSARHGVVAANYLAELVDLGMPFEQIYAVPAGAAVDLDVDRQQLTVHRFDQPRTYEAPSLSSARRLAEAAWKLEHHFSQLRRTYPDHRAVICLSGGLDSAVIAAQVLRHFPNATAYTYAFVTAACGPSEDAETAQRLAANLGVPFRLVPADAGDVLAALPDALRYGQDWRDFNVHCAIVNTILAQAIESDSVGTQPVIVFTGDLMNEIVGDYEPVHYRGRQYYPLPDIPKRSLRRSLLRGIQSGDREVGVFSARGLTVIQPYAVVAEDLLSLSVADDKGKMLRQLCPVELPGYMYQRVKSRAQIGNADATTGILPLFADLARDDLWLADAFCRELGIPNSKHLRGAIRAGVYRFPSTFPTEVP